jgi:hypothetical protein
LKGGELPELMLEMEEFDLEILFHEGILLKGLAKLIGSTQQNLQKFSKEQLGSLSSVRLSEKQNITLNSARL